MHLCRKDYYNVVNFYSVGKERMGDIMHMIMEIKYICSTVCVFVYSYYRSV